MISTIDQNGQKLICSLELYRTVGYTPRHYSRWVKREIINNSSKGVDYFDLPIDPLAKRTPGRQGKKYLVTFDFAIAVCLMSKTELAKKLKFWLQIHKNN